MDGHSVIFHPQLWVQWTYWRDWKETSIKFKTPKEVEPIRGIVAAADELLVRQAERKAYICVTQSHERSVCCIFEGTNHQHPLVAWRSKIQRMKNPELRIGYPNTLADLFSVGYYLEFVFFFSFSSSHWFSCVLVSTSKRLRALLINGLLTPRDGSTYVWHTFGDVISIITRSYPFPSTFNFQNNNPRLVLLPFLPLIFSLSAATLASHTRSGSLFSSAPPASNGPLTSDAEYAKSYCDSPQS